MDLKQLAYFVAVVDAGSISAAAKNLHLSQPPLSKQMKQLEADLNCILFQRGARHIELTEAGRTLYERALSILSLSRSTREMLYALSRGKSGHIRIGIVSSAADVFLKKWLKSFHRSYPDIAYELFEANTFQLLEKLEEGALDFAVVRTPFPATGFATVPLMTEPIIALGHHRFFEQTDAKSPLSSEDALPLSALCGMPIILYRRWEAVIRSELSKAQIDWQFFCINDDARTTVLWANEGLGVAIVPASAASYADPVQTTTRLLDGALPKSTISVVYSKTAALSEAASKFSTFVGAF